MKINQDICKRVQIIVAETLNLTIEKVPPEAVQAKYPEWDSMAYLSIISIIEDEFDITITEENIDKFGGVTQILDEIKKCQKK